MTAYVLFEQQNLMYEVAQIEHAEIRNIQHLAKVSSYRFTDHSHIVV